jgi:uncharacterized membrane protein
MLTYLKIFFVTLIVFLIIDAVWLGFIAPGFYKKEMGSLVRKTGDRLTPNWTAAVIAYIILALGISFFVLPRISATTSLFEIILLGFFFGLVVYGVYDFTNLSTLIGWSWKLTIVDMLWGGTVCALTTFISHQIIKTIGLV